MKPRLCPINAATLLVLVCPAITAAQVSAEHRWVWGLDVGRGARTADAFYDTPWHVTNSGYIDRLQCRDPEYAVSAHVGRFVNTFAHVDAVIGAHNGGYGCGLAFAGVGLPETYREYSYEGNSSGTEFATTSARITLEPGSAESLVRPHASVAIGAILGKWDPTATIAGGGGIGSSRTRFTIDIGEQFYWIRYQLETHDVVNGSAAQGQLRTGTEKTRGLSVRLGIEHAF